MSLRESVDDLRNDLSLVRRDLAALTGELAGLAQAGSQEAKAVLVARIETLQTQAIALQQRIGKQLDESAGRVDDHVRANPYQAVGVAIVLGGVLAWAMTRHCDRR